MKKLNFIKIAEAGVIKILIIIPLILKTMQQLIIKPRRSLGPWFRKSDIKLEIQILEKISFFKKIAKIKILKNIPLHLEAMQ